MYLIAPSQCAETQEKTKQWQKMSRHIAGEIRPLI
jgi:hypothetical protein